MPPAVGRSRPQRDDAPGCPGCCCVFRQAGGRGTRIEVRQRGREEVFIPGKNPGQDQRDREAGATGRQDDLGNHLLWTGAVDKGGFIELFGDAVSVGCRSLLHAGKSYQGRAQQLILCRGVKGSAVYLVGIRCSADFPPFTAAADNLRSKLASWPPRALASARR